MLPTYVILTDLPGKPFLLIWSMVKSKKMYSTDVKMEKGNGTLTFTVSTKRSRAGCTTKTYFLGAILEFNQRI